MHSPAVKLGALDTVASVAAQTKAGSLRNTQPAMIEYHRDKYAAAHPFLWAAFTITGE
jgi:CHAT domain-containing protein